MSAKHQIIVADYRGVAVSFTEEGWFSATAAAANFSKNPNDWLRLPATTEYLAALERRYGKISYVKTSRARADRGGGTWMHPRLAVRFAQWLDMDFAIWCDEQIEQLIRGSHPTHDRARLRHEAAASYKVMSQIVQMSREAQGKTSSPHHFSNEARLVNWAASGEFQSIDRDALSGPALDLLARLEERNAVLIGLGNGYEDRKAKLHDFAAEWTAQHAARLAA